MFEHFASPGQLTLRHVLQISNVQARDTEIIIRIRKANKNITLRNASLRGISALLFMVILEGHKTCMASEARNFHSRGIYDLLRILSALNRWEKIEMLWRGVLFIFLMKGCIIYFLYGCSSCQGEQLGSALLRQRQYPSCGTEML